MYLETPTLENAYKKFGNVMHIEHWFNRMQEADYNTNPLRRSEEAKPKIKAIQRYPLWFKRAVKIEYKPLTRLDLDKTISDCDFISRSGKYVDHDCKSVRELETLARKSKTKDWQIEFLDAFESFIYQRQGRNKWVLIEIGRGYA